MSVFDFANPKISKVLPFILTTGVIVKQGDLLCGDPATGKLVAASAANDTMLPVGFATRDATGDGTHAIEVSLFEPVTSYSFANDTGAPVLLAFTECYVKDTGTVQATATGTCLAGIVLWVSTARVLVRMTPLAPAAVPPI